MRSIAGLAPAMNGIPPQAISAAFAVIDELQHRGFQRSRDPFELARTLRIYFRVSILSTKESVSKEGGRDKQCSRIGGGLEPSCPR
jgi:hypothetical protein